MSTGYDFLDQLRADLVALPSGARQGPRARTPLFAAGGVAIACAIAGVIILARGGSGTVPAASAATFLNKAASSALGTPAAALGRGQFYYEKSRGMDVGTDVAGGSGIGTSEVWMTRDGTGRIVVNGHQTGTFRATAGHPLMTPLGNRQITYAQLEALPADPEQLGAVIRAASLPPGQISASEAQYRTIFELLSGSPWPIPPQVRAGLLRVAATIPGLTLDEATRDCAGRPATAAVLTTLGYDNDKPVRMRLEMLFDPTTNLYLGNRSTVVGQTRPFDCVALLNAGVVNSDNTRP